MRGGALPPAFLCVSLGLALAPAERRLGMVGVLVLATTATVIAVVPIPRGWTDTAFLACWLSVALNSAIVHLPRGLGRSGAVVSSLNAGVWTGAMIAPATSRLDLVIALPCCLSMFLAAWICKRHGSIAVKVVSSWLIAIAVLAAALQFLPVTPGYLPDHIE